MISICILVKNAQETLRSTLDSTRSFPEVILLDTGSTDSTLSIAREYQNVKIFKSEFKGFGDLRNDMASLSAHDWIFALDSDEMISPPLLAEMKVLSLDPDVVYSMPRHNFYNGKRIKGCGWHPDRVARLYHRRHTRFSDDRVHESLLVQREQKLKSPIFHTPYRSTEDFLAKMQHYSSLFAQQYRYKKKSSFRIALAHAVFAFIRSYLFKRGLFDGAEGFMISLYNANTTFYKYLKLAEANQKK